MAGTQTGFDAATFRSKIQFVFNMAATPDADRQLKFYFNDVVTYAGRKDGDAVPFDPTATVTRTSTDPVTVPCGIKVTKASEQNTAFGGVLPTKVTCTLLDEDYDQVKDADYIVFDGEKYLKENTGAPTGLFDVGIYSMTFTAENDA
jgi:hypothetical protein